MSEVRRELSSILENPATEESYLSKSFMGDEPSTKDAATQLLVEKLTEKETEGSIHLLRAFREKFGGDLFGCLLYTSPSPRDQRGSRMPSSA